MKLIFLLFTLLGSLNLIVSFQNDYISDLNIDIKLTKNSPLKTEQNITDCINRYFNVSNPKTIDFLNFTRCMLVCSINNTKNLDEAYIFLNSNISSINTSQLNKNSLPIINIIKKITNKYKLLGGFFDILKKNDTILNSMIKLIDELQKGDDLNDKYALENFYNILKVNETFIWLNKFYSKSRSDFWDFIDIIFSPLNKFYKVINLFKKNLEGYNRVIDIITLFYKLMSSYHSKEKIINIISDFLKENRQLYTQLKEIMKADEMVYVYKDLLIIEDKMISALKDAIFERSESVDLFFDIIKNETLLDEGAELLKYLDDYEYLENNLPRFLENILYNNHSYVENITNLLLYFFIKINSQKQLKEKSLTSIQQVIGKLFLNQNVTTYNISKNCLDLFNYTFFNYTKEDKDFFIYYFQKFLFDSSKSKSNFLTFDNCLDIYNSSDNTDNDYIISPAFVIGIIHEPEKINIYKNTSFFQKYQYLESYCFPYGFKNKKDKENNKPMCNEYDYDAIFTFIFSFSNANNNFTVNTIILNNDNRSPTAKENIYGIISLLSLAIPLVIFLIIIIAKNIIIKKQKRNFNLNQLIGDESKSGKININKGIKNIKKKFPNWYLYINEFFNIIKNGKELFNFSLNNSNYNNVKGITYIKGLIGISIIFTIFGQTFMALANLPTKEYGIWDYYRIHIKPIFVLFLIGYRYSPRVLFSCSGYTLVYKYLCYIEQEQGLYFLKFVFLQFYKYIFLSLMIGIFRYSLYYINILIRQTKRPIWEIFKFYLSRENNFFFRYSTFLFSLGKDVDEIRQNLIIYFYIPLNEIAFFFIGTILISFGYRFKLRIDIIILVLIFILFIPKIIMFLALWYKQGYLTTIDYYLVDYGLSLTNPIFNLSFFLIGMYFGLINYSIQKGITELYNNNNNIFCLRLSELDETDKDIFSERSKSEMNNNFNNSILNNDNESNQEILKNNDSINDTESKKLKSENKKYKNEVSDINIVDNEKIENLIGDENNDQNTTTKREYSKKINQMPFLISPIKFSNFHRNHKNKRFFGFLIFISLFLLLFFLSYEIIYINIELDIDENIEDKTIISKLSMESILPNLTLNIFYLIDLEIVIFIVQWCTFILYFKEIEVIRSFLNHIYWSFFVKSYFTFSIISAIVILFVFYETETVIKLNIYNMIIYTFMFLILIFIGIIIFYSCFELPLKKIFKCLLKGKEILNVEVEDDDEEEEEDNKDKDNENKILKDDNSDDDED